MVGVYGVAESVCVCVCVCVRAVEVGLTSPQSKRKMPYLDRFSGLS